MKMKPIQNKKEHKIALAELQKLWRSRKGTPKGDRLELVMLLVEDYEKKHCPIDPPNAIDAIKFRMDQAGLKQSDLVPYIGTRGRVSEVLSGKRDLTLPMIRKLHAGLGIPLESLVDVSDLQQAAS